MAMTLVQFIPKLHFKITHMPSYYTLYYISWRQRNKSNYAFRSREMSELLVFIIRYFCSNVLLRNPGQWYPSMSIIR